MPELELSFATGQYDRVEPLIAGEVKPQGITLHFSPVAGPDIFYRQLKFSQFDVSEMSFSSFLMARARGWGYQALPVFNHRMFEYTRLLIRKDSGIERPEDLKGKRIGTGDYQQTAALWLRGQLQHEFGVKPTDMEWFMGRSPRYSHMGAVGGFKLQPGLKLSHATKDLGTMLLNGELEAAHYQFGAAIDRATADLTHHPSVRYLFPDRMTEAIRYYKKNGFFPAHHLTVVRESILKKHPWVAISLYEAFEKAKALAIEKLRQANRLSLILFADQWLKAQREVFGDDPYRYGLKANAKMVDTLQTYSVEQGLTERKLPLEELFAEEILIAEDKAS
ncbi:MAG: PhnD/SsuA/transferrin family substrate-binding protein [Deltaproteobacteria bacterium]|nr:PhnD/SsuA/transferrin family substrate-binding protein [Deltaproteobacteria bacterium]